MLSLYLSPKKPSLKASKTIGYSQSKPGRHSLAVVFLPVILDGVIPCSTERQFKFLYFSTIAIVLKQRSYLKRNKPYERSYPSVCSSRK